MTISVRTMSIVSSVDRSHERLLVSCGINEDNYAIELSLALYNGYSSCAREDQVPCLKRSIHAHMNISSIYNGRVQGLLVDQPYEINHQSWNLDANLI